MNRVYYPDAIGVQTWDLKPRRSSPPLSGLLLSLFVVSMVWWAAKSPTNLIVIGVGFLLTLTFLIEWIAGRRELQVPMALAWFAAFIGFCALQMTWAPGNLEMLLTLVQLFVLSAIIVSHETDGRGTILVEYAFYLAVLGTFVYNQFSGEVPFGGRISSTTGNPNTYSLVLMCVAVIALRRILLVALSPKVSFKHLLLPLVFYIACFYGVTFLGGSRKGIILSVVVSVFIVWYWIWQQPPQYRILLTIAVAGVFVGIGYVLYRSPQAERLAYFGHFLEGSGKVDSSISTRADLLQEGLQFWLQRPFTGWGLAMFQEHSSEALYSHNNYVELLANQGLIGTVFYAMIYVSLLVSLARSWLRSKDRLLKADIFWATAVLVMLVTWDFAAVSYYEKTTWIILSLAIGIAARARRTEGLMAEAPATSNEPEPADAATSEGEPAS